MVKPYCPTICSFNFSIVVSEAISVPSDKSVNTQRTSSSNLSLLKFSSTKVNSNSPSCTSSGLNILISTGPLPFLYSISPLKEPSKIDSRTPSSKSKNCPPAPTPSSRTILAPSP